MIRMRRLRLLSPLLSRRCEAAAAYGPAVWAAAGRRLDDAALTVRRPRRHQGHVARLRQQAERFDPDGTYIRRWVAELRSIAGKAVDHAFERPEHCDATSVPDVIGLNSAEYAGTYG